MASTKSAGLPYRVRALSAAVRLAALGILCASLAVGPAPAIAAPVERPQPEAGSAAGVVIAAPMAPPTSTTTTILQHTPDPSLVGDPIWVEFQVVPTSSGSASVDGTIVVSDGTGATCSRTVDPGTTGYPYATGWIWGCNLAPTTSGVKTLTATLTPSELSLFNPSTSAGISHQVNQTSPTISVSVSPGSPVYGQEVTSTANVQPSVYTGLVSFDDEAGTAVGVAALSGGAAQLKRSNLPAGLHKIKAVCLGTGDCRGRESSVLSLTVDKANTTTTLTSSPNPSPFFWTVTFTATVATGTGTPSGTVTFKDGAAAIGTGTLDGSGVAIFTFSTFDVGTHTITAEYGGDSNYNGSTSSSLTQVVGEFSTAV